MWNIERGHAASELWNIGPMLYVSEVWNIGLMLYVSEVWNIINKANRYDITEILEVP
jgi:hypothetical protein